MFVECFVLSAEWHVDCEEGHGVIGVFTNLADAKKALRTRVESDERKFAEENGYTIYDDSDICFDAGVEGYYVCNHTCVNITKSLLYESEAIA